MLRAASFSAPAMRARSILHPAGLSPDLLVVPSRWSVSRSGIARSTRPASRSAPHEPATSIHARSTYDHHLRHARVRPHAGGDAAVAADRDDERVPRWGRI